MRVENKLALRQLYTKLPDTFHLFIIRESIKFETNDH